MNTIEELKKERVQKLNRSGNNVQKVDILLRAVVSAYEIGRSDGAASEQQRIIGMIDAAISDANKNELIADAVKDSELSIHYSRLGCKLKHLNQQILSTPAQEKEPDDVLTTLKEPDEQNPFGHYVYGKFVKTTAQEEKKEYCEWTPREENKSVFDTSCGWEKRLDNGANSPNHTECDICGKPIKIKEEK